MILEPDLVRGSWWVISLVAWKIWMVLASYGTIISVMRIRVVTVLNIIVP